MRIALPPTACRAVDVQFPGEGVSDLPGARWLEPFAADGAGVDKAPVPLRTARLYRVVHRVHLSGAAAMPGDCPVVRGDRSGTLDQFTAAVPRSLRVGWETTWRAIPAAACKKITALSPRRLGSVLGAGGDAAVDDAGHGVLADLPH